ncbi:hypothetical protein GWK47_048714 [Chionoecetes opilio]|uniref:Uncharacterized protein n=1 Tax=Chionoecetes opilio TaxID=41210 RepID=A0A8J4Y2R0_CHIOP|nr:hypothetical protein GWK47_048714 [Chionoecetes opilio]
MGVCAAVQDGGRAQSGAALSCPGEPRGVPAVVSPRTRRFHRAGHPWPSVLWARGAPPPGRGGPVAPAEGCWGDCRTEGFSPQECPKPHFPHRHRSARGHGTPAVQIFPYSKLTCLRQSWARTEAPASPSLQWGKFCKPSRDCQTSQELQRRTRMHYVTYPWQCFPCVRVLGF